MIPTDDELAALLDAVRAPMSGFGPKGVRLGGQLPHIIDLLRGTGARIGEGLALRARDVYESNGRTYVSITSTMTRGAGRQEEVAERTQESAQSP